LLYFFPLRIGKTLKSSPAIKKCTTLGSFAADLPRDFGDFMIYNYGLMFWQIAVTNQAWVLQFCHPFGKLFTPDSQPLRLFYVVYNGTGNIYSTEMTSINVQIMSPFSDNFFTLDWGRRKIENYEQSWCKKMLYLQSMKIFKS